MKRQVEDLVECRPLSKQHQPHPDLVKSLVELKSKVDGLAEHRPAHPDLVKQLVELKEQHRLSNQSLSQQVAHSNLDLIKKLDKVEQALKDSMDADRLDECIRETVGDKPVFLQWMEWMRNLWYSEVPKHSHLWHPQASQGSI